jgi:hypothetical protein
MQRQGAAHAISKSRLYGTPGSTRPDCQCDTRPVFLSLEDLEPYKDQWQYLSMLGRMTPQEVKCSAD